MPSEHVRLEDPAELLYRQVHPAFVQEGRISSSAFNPTKKDDRCLSVARSSMITAKAACLIHLKKYQTVGTCAVAVADCTAEGLGAYADPVPDNAAHAFVDFRGLTTRMREDAAKILARKANVLGLLYIVP